MKTQQIAMENPPTFDGFFTRKDLFFFPAGDLLVYQRVIEMFFVRRPLGLLPYLRGYP